MTTLPTPEAPNASGARAADLFREHCGAVYRRTDALFARLLMAQWAAGIACALWISPLAWRGTTGSIHPHVLAAIFLGGVISALPVLLVRLRPGAAVTRHVIAVAQMLWSALLIDLTGGRIETHFHVFGSLAFLAFYRDWRVLISASVVVAADHFIRGIVWPQSVFGIAALSRWRWLEHAGWVGFEDGFLIASCARGLTEMRAIAERQARLEDGKAAVEHEVRERTGELRSANNALLAAATEREALHARLLAASRQAGKAEVATGVLHNVGNVLNSVNVAAAMIAQTVERSEVASLSRAGAMLDQHRTDLAQFLTRDDRGKHLTGFLVEVAKTIEDEQRALVRDLGVIRQGVDHIKNVIHMQQTHAKQTSVVERVRPTELVEAALLLHGESLARHGIQIERRFSDSGPMPLDRHRILEILVNLLANAKEAMRECPTGSRRLTLEVGPCPNRPAAWVRFAVRDTGVGIAAEHLDRIFRHGFTTRKDGHGFGLHSAANAANAMGGALTASSPGPGWGATFELVLPPAKGSVLAEPGPPAMAQTTQEVPCTGS